MKTTLCKQHLCEHGREATGVVLLNNHVGVDKLR